MEIAGLEEMVQLGISVEEAGGLLKNAAKRAEKFAIEWAGRHKECQEHGHREPVELMPYIPSNQGGRYVLMTCKYCLATWRRGLNKGEQEKYRDFLKKLQEPMTR
jgi:hypothetical protein